MLQDLDVDGKISKSIFNNEGADWVHLAQNRDQKRGIVNTVMNFRLHNMRGISSETGLHKRHRNLRTTTWRRLSDAF
jgi:hypothetical protein